MDHDRSSVPVTRAFLESLARRTIVGAAIAAALATAMVMFGGQLAHAVLGGPVPSTLAFSGTLTGTSGPQTLTFTFRNGSQTCAPSVNNVMPEAGTGAFSVQIPIGTCSAALMDDPATTMSVSVGGMVVAPAGPIHAVPFARYAERLGTALCPTGYDRDTSETAYVVCRRGSASNYDVVVRVGEGSSAFWIDRYEASVWTGPNGTGTQRGASTDDYEAAFPDNGQWVGTSPILYAASRVGVTPSRELTWFQAMEACRASGKRLPSGQEWLAAARATPDGGGCNVTSGGPRATGMGSSCRSAWGADDMIGNLFEWTDEWYAGVGNATANAQPWPASYAQDVTSNIVSSAYSEGPPVVGLPAAGLRGGQWLDGPRAGVFALSLDTGPSYRYPTIGFRCVVER